MGDRQDKLEIVRVAHSEAMLNGVAVSPGGRIFSSFPRWTEIPTPSLAEAMPDGSFKPYPGGAWNEWRPGLPAGERFVAVHSAFADANNNLWVVDDAAPFHSAYVEGGPKLVKIDLATDRVTRIYPIGPTLAPPGAVLGHVRIDERFAYLTESRAGSIIVIELETGASHRLLAGHPKTRADPSIVPVIEGKEFRLANGKVQQVNVNLLELSHDGKYLYFMALFGPRLMRIETRYLQDSALSDADLGAMIEDVVSLPPCAGIVADQRGNLYFSSFTQDAILRMLPDKTLGILVTDPRISFPNEGSIGKDGYLYFPSSQVHRIALFHADGVSRVKTPWEIFKVKLPE
jgi:Major royal jelly protein